MALRLCGNVFVGSVSLVRYYILECFAIPIYGSWYLYEMVTHKYMHT